MKKAHNRGKNKVLYVATYGDFFASFQIDNMKLWQSLDCEVHCAANFTEKHYNRFTDRIDQIGAIRHEVGFLRTPFSLKNLEAYRQLKQLMKDEDITILDTHNPIASMFSRLAAWRCGIDRVVYTVHGFFFYKGAPVKKQLIYRPLESMMARLTDALIVTNIEDYEAAKQMQVRGEAYYVHGVGVDTASVANLKVDVKQKRKELGIPEDAIVLCSVGECIKRKNQESAIRAFATIDDPRLRYVVVGDGELYGYLQNLVKELNMENRVFLPGYRTDANEILKASDIYIFPSYQEGLSVALMQAMAAGLPIVASNIRGNNDCVDHEKGGILVEADRIDGIAAAIIDLAHDEKKRIEFGKYNQHKVEQFNKKVVWDENSRIFGKILQMKEGLRK